MKVALLLAVGVLVAPLAVHADATDEEPAAVGDSFSRACPDAHLLVSRVRADPAGVAWERVRGHEAYPKVEAAMTQAAAEGRTVNVDMPSDEVSQLSRSVRIANNPQPLADGRVSIGDRVAFQGYTFSFGVLARCLDSAP